MQQLPLFDSMFDTTQPALSKRASLGTLPPNHPIVKLPTSALASSTGSLMTHPDSISEIAHEDNQVQPTKENSHKTKNPANTETVRHITLAGQVIAYRFKRTSRRTIGLTINEDGLSVSAPRWASYKNIDGLLTEKQKWIFNKLVEVREQQARSVTPPISWENGASLPYLGKNITLHFSPMTHIKSAAPTLSKDGSVLCLCLPQDAGTQQIRDRVQSWMKKQALVFFTERLDHYAQQLGVEYTRLSLSSATTRWGSCNSEGHIRLNWRLLHFSPTIIDYVVAHELAHLKEMNHSSRFWDTVASIFPEYDNARAHLNRQNVPNL